MQFAIAGEPSGSLSQGDPGPGSVGFTFGDESNAHQQEQTSGQARKRRNGNRAPGGPQSEEQEAKLRRQQMLNKAAQQRYRQRRKERQQTIEMSLVQMQEQNSALQAQVMALEAALMAAKVSIRDPSDQPHLNGGADMSPGGGGGGAVSGDGGSGGGGAAAGPRGGGAAYRSRVAAVQAFVREHRVRELHAAGQPLPPEASEELQSLVAACARSCAVAIDVTSPEALWPLGGGGVEGGSLEPTVGATARTADKQRWLQVLADVSLTDDQMRELLQLRGGLLDALGRCLDERNALAQRISGAGAGAGAGGNPAATALSPIASTTRGNGTPPQGAAAAQQQQLGPAGLQQGGYFDSVAHSSLAAREATLQIQAGIAAEGRAIREFTLRVLTGVLTTEQAGVLIDRAPNAADVLNLANSLSELCDMVPHLGSLRGSGSGGGGPAGALPASAIVAAAAAAAAAAMMRSPAAAEGQQQQQPAQQQQRGGGGGGFPAGGPPQRVPSSGSVGGRVSEPRTSHAGGRLAAELHAHGDPQLELQLQLQRQAAAVAQLQMQRQAAQVAQQQVQLQLQRQAAQVWAATHQVESLERHESQDAPGAGQQLQHAGSSDMGDGGGGGGAGAGGGVESGAAGEQRDLQLFMHQLMVAEAPSPRRGAATAAAQAAAAAAATVQAAQPPPDAPAPPPEVGSLPSLPGSLRGASGPGGAPSLLAAAAMDALPGDVLMADDDLLSSLDYLLGDGAGI